MKNITAEHHSFVKYKNPYICLTAVGFDKCISSHSHSDSFDNYTIYVINSGKGVLTLDSKIYKLKRNDVFLIKPNQKAKYTVDTEGACNYAYFSFSGVLVQTLLQDLVFSNSPVYSLKDDTVFSIIEEILTNIDKCKSARIFSLEYLFKLFSEFVSDTGHIEYVDNGILSKVEEYIKNHYTESIKVGDIADIYNINRNYLFRIFKKKHGVSIKSYIMLLKVEEAKQLLLNTDMSFSQISEHLGFLNYSTFLRLFKSQTGKTPGEYRDLIGKNI